MSLSQGRICMDMLVPWWVKLFKGLFQSTSDLFIFTEPVSSVPPDLSISLKPILLQKQLSCYWHCSCFHPNVNTVCTETCALKSQSTSPAKCTNLPKSHFQDWFKSDVSTHFANFQNIYHWIPRMWINQLESRWNNFHGFSPLLGSWTIYFTGL